MNVLSIEVTADIHRNYFDDGQPYYYNNIRAVNESEREALDRAISIMYNSDSPLLSVNQPITPRNIIEPVEKGAKFNFDLENMSFQRK